jgi:hypothetical protein
MKRKEKRTARKEIIRKEEDEEKYQQHIPGSGRPCSLSDPLLHYTSYRRSVTFVTQMTCCWYTYDVR